MGVYIYSDRNWGGKNVKLSKRNCEGGDFKGGSEGDGCRVLIRNRKWNFRRKGGICRYMVKEEGNGKRIIMVCEGNYGGGIYSENNNEEKEWKWIFEGEWLGRLMLKEI